MAFGSGPFPFADFEARALRMSTLALKYARLDCAETAELWDGFDREHGTCIGGRYRDEASVYARELDRRVKEAA